MQSKLVLGALGAAITLALIGGSTASAESDTDKKKEQPSEVIVTVKAGDTLEQIADKHDLTYVELYNANKDIANPDQIDVGDKIRIPSEDEELPDRFSDFQAQLSAAMAASNVTVTPQANGTYVEQRFTSAPVSSSSYYVGNGMWCTDYVHSKRPDVAVYGNAGYNWVSAAQAEGKATGSTPRAGAIAVMNGHVAYVESVNSDGSYVVSEMGWNYQAGNFNQRTVQPGAFGGFIY